MQLSNYSEEQVDQDLKFLAKTPYVYHCHHFNLFHDQTVEDAVGMEEGYAIKARAAQRASWQLLTALVQAVGAQTPAERLQAASELFSWMGQGRLEWQADSGGGAAKGSHLHYSFSWREKYGSRIKRNFPIDAFAAGFAAAATEVAFGLGAGALQANEGACFACRENACDFTLASHGSTLAAENLDSAKAVGLTGPGIEGLEEAKIAKIAAGLKEFLLGVDSDERGLVQGFSIFVTRHLSSYYDRTAYDTILQIEQNHPQATEAVEQLFGESGHVCVFHTFGNLLLSPEWEGLVGPLRGEVEEIVTGCTAIARGLGFGHWTIQELEPDKRLVLRSASNYESPFYLHNYGQANKPRCYFFANAARAFMQLAHRVDWPSRPVLDDSLYQALFKGDLRWHVEETLCRSKGDEVCEVVVSKA